MKLTTKHIFVFCLLLGAIVYCFSFLYSPNNKFVDVCLWTIMISYALSVKYIPEEKRDLLDADNAYYMGFIFTMASLATILYNVDVSKTEGRVSSIISGFALALSTTILGIILRILLTPRRIDIGSSEEESRNELDRSVKCFTKIIDDSNTSIRNTVEIQSKILSDTFLKSTYLLDSCFERLNSSIVSNYESINDLLENKVPQTIQRNEDALILLNSSIATSAKRINDSIDTLVLSMIETNKTLLKYNTSITTSFNSNIDSINSFTDRINDLKIDPAFIKAHLESVFLIYKNAAIKASKTFEVSSEALNDLVKEIKNLPETIKHVLYSSHEDRQWITKNIENATEVLNNLHRQILDIKENITDKHGDTYNLLERLTESVSAIEEIIPYSSKTFAITSEFPAYLSQITLLINEIKDKDRIFKSVDDSHPLVQSVN